jgi:hypothetical protein
VARPEHSAVNVDVISPATEKHISKHSAQAFRLVLESPELYARATRPFIESIPPARLAWVTNILDKKARGPDYHVTEGLQTMLSVHSMLGCCTTHETVLVCRHNSVNTNTCMAPQNACLQHAG